MLILRPLARRPVALLWGGLSLSAVGDQLYAVALSWIAVGAFGAAAGFLSALGAGTVIAAAVLVAGRADRLDQRRAMIGADLLRAAVLLLVVAAWLGTGAPSAAALVAAVVVLASGQAVFQPALQSVLPAAVADRALLPAANGLLDATERIARLLGPGLVGLLAGWLPVVHFLTLDALSFLASALAVAAIGPLAAAARAGTRENFAAAALRGFRALRRETLLWWVLGVTGPINGAWYAAFFLGLPLAIERAGITGPGGTGLAAYGLVISSYGVTNLLSTLVVGSRPLSARPGAAMFAGSLIVGAGVLALAAAETWAPSLPALCAAAGLSAIGGPMKDIPVAVLRQTLLPPADVAAATRAFLIAGQGGILVGMLAAPVALATVGPAAGTAACGALIAALGVLGVARFRAPRARAA